MLRDAERHIAIERTYGDAHDRWMRIGTRQHVRAAGSAEQAMDLL